MLPVDEPLGDEQQLVVTDNVLRAPDELERVVERLCIEAPDLLAREQVSTRYARRSPMGRCARRRSSVGVSLSRNASTIWRERRSWISKTSSSAPWNLSAQSCASVLASTSCAVIRRLEPARRMLPVST